MSASASPGDTDPIRVVLVDDHQMFTESLARVLEHEPTMQVVGVASDLPPGVRLARTTSPDVIVLGQHLAAGDAPTTAARLLEASPSSKLVVLSSRGDSRILLDAFEAGCTGYVTTSQSIDDLLTAVRQVHAGEPYVPTAMLGSLLPRWGAKPIGADLSDRERQVLDGLARGLTNASLAEELILSVHTIRGHVQRVLMKLGAHSRLEAVAIASREGLVSPRSLGRASSSGTE